MPSNQAAWLTAKSIRPLEVKTAPYTQPGKNEIVIKNAAVAINPLDMFKQALGNLFFGWIKYPFVMGSDCAGEVVEVGEGVTRFRVGDRVLGNAVGMDPRVNKSSEGAFQEYTVLRATIVSPIPDSLSYENACVLPLGVSTAACGLFMKENLGLSFPSTTPTPSGKTVLVWGGSSSVGSNAVQLAVAAGYDVITTCSPRNFDFVKKLGAGQVFDYNSPTVIKDIIDAFKDRVSAGAFAVGTGSLDACIEVLAACKGKKFVAQISHDAPEIPTTALAWIPVGMSWGWSLARTEFRSRTKRVCKNFVFGTDLAHNEVGKAIYEDFLPAALAEGKYQCLPVSQVVGTGLGSLQEAIDSMKGVSAKKLVVLL